MKKVLKVLTVCSLLSLSVFSQEKKSNKDLMKKEKTKASHLDNFQSVYTIDSELKFITQVGLTSGELIGGSLTSGGASLGYLLEVSNHNKKFKIDGKSLRLILKDSKKLREYKDGIKAIRKAYLPLMLVSGCVAADGYFRFEAINNKKNPGIAPLVGVGLYYGGKVFNYCNEDEKASGEITENDKIFTKEEARIDVSSRELKKEVEREDTEKSSGEASQKKV